MTGIQYNIALSIFFIPYILLEVPSNVILKKFKRPSTYLGMLVVSWGIIMTLTGIVKNFAGLMVCRVLLGVAEAGFFRVLPNAHERQLLWEWAGFIDNHAKLYLRDVEAQARR